MGLMSSVVTARQLGEYMEITDHFTDKELQERYLDLPVVYEFMGTLLPTSIGAPLILTTAIGVWNPTPVTVPGLVAPVMCNHG